MSDHPWAEKFEILGADGRTYPADLATARQWVTEGRITPATQVYDAAAGEWKTARDVESLFPRVPPVVSSSPRSTTQGCQAAVLLALLAVLVGLIGSSEPTCAIAAAALFAAAIIIGVIYIARSSR